MKPIKFKESNITLAKDQPQYQQLPIHRDGKDNEGRVTSCWKLSFKERIKLLFTGNLWLSMMTFHKQPMPVLPTVHKYIVLGGMSKKEYKKALKRIDELVKENPEEHTLGWNELQGLGDKVIEYERVYYPINIDIEDTPNAGSGAGN